MPEPPQLPPIATQPLSVLLLGQSDQPGLEEALRAWIGHLNGLNRSYELILVVDALLDRTAELATNHPSIRVLRAARRGAGAALRVGLAAATHPLLLYAPCDNRYQPKDAKLLLDEIDRTDVVIGHRVGRRVPLVLRCLGFVWRGMFRVLFGLPLEPLPAWLGWSDHARNLFARAIFALRLHDIQCEFRLFRRSVFRRIPIQSDGPFVHVEVLAKANFLTAVMTDVPVSYQPLAEPASWWKEAWHIFAHPEFGPAVLPPEPVTNDPSTAVSAAITREPPADCGLLQPATDANLQDSIANPPLRKPASGAE
jgi:glycosyltransferase involved in cell wall biosynthesis